MTAPSYFHRLSETRFQPTEHVGGAWNPAEQHIAPTIGLLAHLVEADHAQRRDGHLRLARVAYEILGVLTLDPVDVTLRVIRPGRTIELVEAELSQHGRTAVILRAWLLQRIDTAAIAGSAFDPLPTLGEMPADDFDEKWPGDSSARWRCGASRSAPGDRSAGSAPVSHCWTARASRPRPGCSARSTSPTA
ncbi:acyl-CoA thioesterase domain-containing protein [Microbacterium sp. NIBRBAC000506063]|uniref:acyl-CoA thioesterase domain-containing protein n=1 Tax=Microbacterium sp. NIBRBAC000506063 TaxID=2734618 RepID=UPI00398061D9